MGQWRKKVSRAGKMESQEQGSHKTASQRRQSFLSVDSIDWRMLGDQCALGRWDATGNTAIGSGRRVRGTVHGIIVRRYQDSNISSLAQAWTRAIHSVRSHRQGSSARGGGGAHR